MRVGTKGAAGAGSAVSGGASTNGTNGNGASINGTAAAGEQLGDALAAPRTPIAWAHPRAARALKRGFDLVGSLALLILLAPLLLLIAAFIKLDSPGPVLFRQQRIGRNGKPFGMFKFRTMIRDADAKKLEILHLNVAGDGLFKIPGDPRLTRFGQFLRSTSLDELPQLLHVVSGRMSLVGPRPLVPEEDALIIGEHRARHSVRPGMTGVWQVGGASAIPIHEMVWLDCGYVENWSLWLDLKLLAATSAHVVMRRGM